MFHFSCINTLSKLGLLLSNVDNDFSLVLVLFRDVLSFESFGTDHEHQDCLDLESKDTVLGISKVIFSIVLYHLYSL